VVEVVKASVAAGILVDALVGKGSLLLALLADIQVCRKMQNGKNSA
jgi:hypothetical protein